MKCYITYLGGSTGSLTAFRTGICEMFDAVCTDKKLTSVSVDTATAYFKGHC